MRILATGKTGTICRHLPDSVVSLNFRDLDSIKSQLSKFGREELVLIHGAGVVGPSQVARNPDEARIVNVDKTLELAKMFIEAGNERSKFVFISTAHVYRASADNIPETAITEPNNLYAAQKLEAEILLREIFDEFPENLLILRVFSIIGAEVPEFTLGGAVLRALRNPTVTIANCDDERDFLSPRQAAELIYQVSTVPSAAGSINIGTGHGLTVKEGARMLAAELGGKLPSSSFETGQSALPRLVSDNSVMLRMLDLESIIFRPN